MKSLALLCILSIALAALNNTSAFNDTATPIKHVIIIVQENHSFDNYYGTYPTANGTLTDGVTTQLQRVNGIPHGTCAPYGETCLSPYRANSSIVENPVEGQTVYESDYDQGRMDGFANHSGPQSLVYFDYTQLAAYWTYAEEYGLAENYFAPVISTTNPNRLFLLAGDSPVAGNNGPPPFLPYNETILYQLSAQGVSWSYFDFFGANPIQNPIPPINYLSGLDRNALGQIQNVSVFFRDIAENQLPSVSFVNAIGFDTLDEHPPSNVTLGELWVTSIVNSIMQSDYWSSSAIFITYDEGGGYYDHVSPPQVFTIDHDFAQPLHGYGQRVPLLVISPFAKENYVSNVLLSHMSLLHFLDYNWRLPLLNQNVASSNNLLDFFYFNETGRPPIILTAGGPYSFNSYPAPIQIPLNTLPYSRNGSSNSTTGTTLKPPTAIPIIPVAVLALVMSVLIGTKAYRRFKSHRSDLVTALLVPAV